MIQRIPRSEQPAPDIRLFRQRLSEVLGAKDSEGRTWADAKWGVYAFYDWDGEPIYVGQTNEQLRTRVRRHLTNQRTDAVAMRVLDVFEVAELVLYPLWEYEACSGRDAAAKDHLNSLEYSVYLDAIRKSRFGAILNEKIPPASPVIDLPSCLRSDLLAPAVRATNSHLDVRLARRAESISRLADVVRERGEVSEGLRWVLLVQAVRLSYMSACRLAEVEGRDVPDPALFRVEAITGVDQRGDYQTGLNTEVKDSVE